MSIMSIINAISEFGIMIVIAGIFLYTTIRQNRFNNERYNQMFNKIMKIETSHTAQDEVEIIETEDQINAALKDLLFSSNSARTLLIRYHNGGKDLNNISFLKMSVTNEEVRSGIKPLMQDFTNQFRSLFSGALRELKEKEFLYISDISVLRAIDYALYSFLEASEAVAMCAVPINDEYGNGIGVLTISYQDIGAVRGEEELSRMILEKKIAIETLLNIAKRQRTL